jgi:glucosyl-dolichyl phosphate glucuronosyltransferase
MPSSISSPFVSVIVPTYNRADMLAITIESLFVQSYDKKKYEIIIADNNSSDHTRQVVR